MDVTHTIRYSGRSRFIRAGGSVVDPSDPSSETGPATAWACAGTWSGAALNGWRGSSVGLWADMGEGADIVHGTPGADRLSSNYADFSHQYVWGSGFQTIEDAPADGSLDLMCGGAGDDFLYGDLDDDYTDDQEERMDGGAGVDYCDGDPFFFDGNDVSDVEMNCEGPDDAFAGGAFYLACSTYENPLAYVGL